MQIDRLSSSENFVCKRQKLIFNTFLDFKLVERFESMRSVRELGSVDIDNQQHGL